MTNRIRHCLAGFLIVVLCSIYGSGQTPKSTGTTSEYELRVGGEVERELKLGPDDPGKLAHRSVQAKDHSGAEVTFDGVMLIDVLQLAGVKFGDGLRGKSLALYLVVEAADGYRVVFALPELDPGFADRVVLPADRRDGKKLSNEEGPLRIVVVGEKRQARWVRQVRSLIIKRA